MSSVHFTKKFLGTIGILFAFLITSFIGVTSASAYFSFGGKSIQFHAIVEGKTATSLTLLTSAPNPITVTINGSTKYPKGKPNIGDEVFVVARVKNEGGITALIVKKSRTGGPGDQYGHDHDGDDVHEHHSHYSHNDKDKKCPWIRSNDSRGNAHEYKVTPSTRFIGVANCESLRNGDEISVEGADTRNDGFIAKTVIKHTGKGGNLPENEEDEE